MIDTIYVERAVRDHPRSRAIVERFPRADVIPVDRYGEVFNRHAQNFRLQKQNPALLLARKQNEFVLPAPPGYGIGGRHNYYFSHMMNCVYDCRYCFLQGMYRSAHYVVFVNFEDFGEAIRRTAMSIEDGSVAWFFSGYDCDSLALEPVTRFCRWIIPCIGELAGACLEIRTKSTQVRGLLEMTPLSNVVVAFSFTPQAVSRDLEHRVAPVDRRIDAMARLAARGWRLGIRLDPIVFHDGYETAYRNLLDEIFKRLPRDSIHSVTTGTFRMPREFMKAAVRLYPDERLFAGDYVRRGQMFGYPQGLEEEMVEKVRRLVLDHVEPGRLFHCPAL